jgi:hypothetical protein
MACWETRFLRLGASEWDAKMEEWGKAGWELVAVVPENYRRVHGDALALAGAIAFFKRTKIDP